MHYQIRVANRSGTVEDHETNTKAILATWWSLIGFQSCSMKISVSAEVRFKPSPPTVDCRYTSEHGNSWIWEEETNLKSIHNTMCCQQEHINSRIRIKSFHNFKTPLWFYGAIQSQVCDTALNQMIHLVRENKTFWKSIENSNFCTTDARNSTLIKRIWKRRKILALHKWL